MVLFFIIEVFILKKPRERPTVDQHILIKITGEIILASVSLVILLLQTNFTVFSVAW